MASRLAAPSEAVSASTISTIWSEYCLALSGDSTLPYLKAFRDNLFCDAHFVDKFCEDPLHFLADAFPMLNASDVCQFFPAIAADHSFWTSEISDSSRLLRKALDVDQLQRRHFLRLEPTHLAWSRWRQQQIARLSSEYKTIRASQIMHIPFAFELTNGCSGRCSFCGLSAPPLQESSASVAFDRFEAALDSLGRYAGNLAHRGVLYWATDPMDHPQYEQYANAFAIRFGSWPSTTTALAENQPSRLSRWIDAQNASRPWSIRCSLRTPSAYRKLCSGLDVRQRARIRLLPQYHQKASDYQARAGRLYSSARHRSSSVSRSDSGGTIACVSGFLISLPRSEIKLVTPCCAEELNPNGYRTLSTRSFSSSSSLLSEIDSLLSELTSPSLLLDDYLRPSVHYSQYHFYQSPLFPDFFTQLDSRPLKLADLAKEVSDQSTRSDFFTYCLELIKMGVVSQANS